MLGCLHVVHFTLRMSQRSHGFLAHFIEMLQNVVQVACVHRFALNVAHQRVDLGDNLVRLLAQRFQQGLFSRHELTFQTIIRFELLVSHQRVRVYQVQLLNLVQPRIHRVQVLFQIALIGQLFDEKIVHVVELVLHRLELVCDELFALFEQHSTLVVRFLVQTLRASFQLVDKFVIELKVDSICLEFLVQLVQSIQIVHVRIGQLLVHLVQPLVELVLGMRKQLELVEQEIQELSKRAKDKSEQ